jgi:peptidyl-prolyl cis-trans isomerase D
MMESLRNFLSGPRLVVIIALLALPFVFLGTSSLGTVFSGSLGSINGEEVTELDYTVAANIRANKLKETYGEQFNFNELDSQLQVDLIRQELITQKVFLSEARSLGLLNDEEVKIAKKSIVQDPSYRDENGNFDEALFEAVANQNGFSKNDYINLSGNINAIEKYRFSLSGSLFQLPNEISKLVNILEKKADINFVKIDSQSLKDSIKNTLTEQVEYYNQNQELFYEDELRNFQFFSLASSDYSDKVEIPEDYATNYYEDYLSKAQSNIQKKFSHIMIDKTNYENNIDALSKIELIKLQLDEGSSFEDLVAEYSEDIVTKDQGGNLDYFEEDVFPEEFGSALKDMQNSDISSIIEIDSSYHILKVTEVLEEKIKTFDEISSEIIGELISAESLALLNDDFNELDQLSLEGSTINDLAAFASKEIKSSSLQSISSINVEYGSQISDIVFDDSLELNTPKVIDLDGTIYVLSVSEIKEPELKPFALVQEEVNSSLIEINASVRRTELEKEYLNLSLESDKKSFVEENPFVSSESFKDIKRYSSLLPQDILRSLFESNPGSELSLSSINGDHYFITLNAYTYPTDIEKQEVVDQYTPFDTERLADRMNDIMNDDLFDTAKIDLNEQIFTQE